MDNYCRIVVCHGKFVLQNHLSKNSVKFVLQNHLSKNSVKFVLQNHLSKNSVTFWQQLFFFLILL